MQRSDEGFEIQDLPAWAKYSSPETNSSPHQVEEVPFRNEWNLFAKSPKLEFVRYAHTNQRRE
jgi:hypothetical protein